ncbi:hypothetical protein BXT84_15450 [Sulfobacillus thermotolerans]|uniref:Uncharacterized protein n=1 Tax=Sulfobacillus thermotolerans TaxID=338644 RepID=A0ABM6RUJ5_9FIRM|nr:hypothetical protein BXT84_15450 [Sulfobacillus thermotolerans]
MGVIGGSMLVVGGLAAIGLWHRDHHLEAMPNAVVVHSTVSQRVRPHVGRAVHVLPAHLDPAPTLTWHTVTTTTVPIFAGTQVQIATNPNTPSILPPYYPLRLNPLASYVPRHYTLSFQLSAMLNGQPVVLQIFKGPGHVLMASSYGGQVQGTALVDGTLTLTNFSQDSAYLSVQTKDVTQWASYNLLTGALQFFPSMPLEAVTTSSIAGLETTWPVPVIVPEPRSHAITPKNPESAQSAETQCLAEANILLNSAVLPSQVVWTQQGTEAVLSRLDPGRWQSVTFVLRHTLFVPRIVTATTTGMTLRYHVRVAQDGQAQSVLLSEPEIRVLTQYTMQQPYSATLSQAGALALLPRDFNSAEVLHPGAPKILIQQGLASVLGLTYQVSDKGQQAYIPVGWYWWTHGPTVLPPAPSLPSSPSTSPSPTASSGLTPAS